MSIYIYIYTCIIRKILVKLNMNQSNIGLLDLPNEILLIILKKLDNMDALYSLLDVDNQRLDIIAQENISTNTLNFVWIQKRSTM